MGTGSGIIAISAKLERDDAQVFASDVSEEALKVAQQNAVYLNADVEFAQGSWFEAMRKFRLFIPRLDIIVSNPPYIEQDDIHLSQGDLRFEPQGALTDFADGLSAIRILAENAKLYLKNKGWLLLEHGYNQAEAVQEILQQHGYNNIETQQDLAGLNRITFGQWG